MASFSIAANEDFFARIVAMIPQDLYKHTENISAELGNAKYFKHRKVALTADEKKKISSLKKREKYLQGEGESETNLGSADITEAPTNDGDAASTIYVNEDLRSRLQNKIVGLKADRASKKQIKSQQAQAEKHFEKVPLASKKVAMKVSESVVDLPQCQAEAPQVHATNDVEFSIISDGNSDRAASSAPGSKMKRLKRLLDVADRKRKRLDDLKASGEQGKKQVKEELWVDAMKSASGEKTISDSSKLKKAIKRREKKKETSARQWKERIDTVQSEKNQRLEKREENLSKRKKGAALVKDPSSTQTQDKKRSSAATASNQRPHDSTAKKVRAGFEGKAKPKFLNRSANPDAKK